MFSLYDPFIFLDSFKLELELELLFFRQPTLKSSNTKTSDIVVYLWTHKITFQTITKKIQKYKYRYKNINIFKDINVETSDLSHP